MESNAIDSVKLAEVSSEVTLPSRPEATGKTKTDLDQKVSTEPLESESSSVPVTEQEVKEVAEFLNNSSNLFNLSLSFRVSVNEEIDRVIVSVYDTETDEVIKQIPSEEVVALAERLNEMVGVFFNETA